MKDPDVIVIGSGMGGNAVSSILSRFGKKVGLWEGGMVIFCKYTGFSGLGSCPSSIRVLWCFQEERNG